MSLAGSLSPLLIHVCLVAVYTLITVDALPIYMHILFTYSGLFKLRPAESTQANAQQENGWKTIRQLTNKWNNYLTVSFWGDLC